MFFVNKNITIKEIKQEIDEVLKPIKTLCDFWNVPIEYDGDAIKTNVITEKVNINIERIKQMDDESLQESFDNFTDIKNKLILFTESAKNLKPLDRFLIYHVFIEDNTQVELSEDGQLWEKFQIYNVSPAKVNHLFQDACLKLLELIRYNQIKIPS